MGAAQEQIRTSRLESPIRSPRDERQGRVAPQSQRKQSQWLNRVSFAACCLISFAAVWLVASKGASIYRLNDANIQLQTQIQQQQASNAALSTVVAQLKEPSRILNVAMNQLHMQYKTPVVIPSVKTGQ